MKNKILSRLLITVVLILTLYPSFQVQAKVQEFTDLYLELNLPEDTVILTKDTPNTDEQWKTAGITDPKSEKDSFTDMGVQAILFDPTTKTTVRLLQKQSSETKNIFNLSLLSEEKLTEFFSGLTGSSDETTKTAIAKYPHQEATFFRYSVEMTQNGQPLSELIYGTIVNGSSLTFDMFKKNITDPFDESFVKELVAGTHFTKLLDKAEVEKQERESIIRLIIGFVILIAIIVVWILISKNKRKKLDIIKKNKTEALTRFYIEQTQNEEKNIKDTVLFSNRTKYTEEIIKNYCYYNEFIKKFKFWISMAVLYIVILALLVNTNNAIFGFPIAIILLFVFIYYQGIRIEKLVNSMMKIYDKKKSMDAVFTFYEKYFTLSGIQFISKYPYSQITEIKEYKNYIYIYLGPEKAFYLKNDGFEQGTDNFISFITTAAKSV
ncbi:MAG: YcxB family protein [Anaerocolumna sp.]